jgi:hypothetical protein
VTFRTYSGCCCWCCWWIVAAACYCAAWRLAVWPGALIDDQERSI